MIQHVHYFCLDVTLFFIFASKAKKRLLFLESGDILNNN